MAGNPNTDEVILNAFSSVATTGTAFATKGGTVYVKNQYAMLNGNFPALNLKPGHQKYMRNSNVTFDGGIDVIAEYCDRWDEQTTTIDVIRQNIDADMELMMENIMHNDTLTVQNVAHAISAHKVTLSPYDGEVRDYGGLKLVQRTMVVSFNILPFDV